MLWGFIYFLFILVFPGVEKNTKNQVKTVKFDINDTTKSILAIQSNSEINVAKNLKFPPYINKIFLQILQFQTKNRT